jgi:hypothetical protein
MVEHRPTLEAEWSLLRAACSPHPEESAELESSLVPSIRWDALFPLAEQHGVLPLLYLALSGVESSVPEEQMRRLKQMYQANLHKALFLSREFIRIADCLEAIGIDFLPYKGLALAEALYGDIALRQSGDIDLIIRLRDLGRIREAVGKIGYTPHTSLSQSEQDAYLKAGYECAFDSALGHNLLEVQWAIQPRFYAVDFQMDGLFERAVPTSVAGHGSKTPAPEDLFIVLSLHAAKHAWGRLIWLCDLSRMAQCPSLNWRWIGSQAQRLGVVRIVRVGLLLAKWLLSDEVPAGVELNLPDDPQANGLAEKIARTIIAGNGIDVESLDYFRLMVRLRERKADQLRFLSRLAFTPGPGEWSAVRLPRALFPLYRLVRISRLAARVVSG